ncbi:MAG: hypothetical protein ACP5VE_05950 [Chthonomonadales bacterium]
MKRITHCRRILLSAALICLLAVPRAHSQIIAYTDPVAFGSVSSGMTTIDFASLHPPVGGSLAYPSGLTISGVNFFGKLTGPDYQGVYLYVIPPTYAPTTYAGWNTNPTVLQGPGGMGSHYNGYLQITLPAGITAVGFNVYTIHAGGGPNGAPITVTTPSGQVFNFSTFNKPDLAFVGFTSPNPITWLRVTQPGADFANISHFTFGYDPPQTPVPAAPVVVLIGSAVWGVLFRRRAATRTGA